jgi:hypothetical protein
VLSKYYKILRILLTKIVRVIRRREESRKEHGFSGLRSNEIEKNLYGRGLESASGKISHPAVTFAALIKRGVTHLL